MIVFRIVHILAAVLWVGSAFLFTVFIGPTAAELGPAAFPMMKTLVEERHVPRVIEILSGSAVLGGLFLYWHDWHAYGSFGSWLGHPFGIGITIGAISAIAAFFVGNFGIGQTVEKIVEVGNAIAAADGPPPQQLLVETERLGARVKAASQVDLVLLLIAVVTMATARYW